MLTSSLWNPLSCSFFNSIFWQNKPPFWSNVLSWIKGGVDGDELRSFALSLGNFPLQLVNGPCLSPNGVDDYFTIVGIPADATITYQGTAVSVVDAGNDRINTTSAGTFYDLKIFSGDVLWKHFPCIGKTATADPEVILATDGTPMILVTSDLVAMHAGVQQSYFYEMANGYAERENYAFDTRMLEPEWGYTDSKAVFSEDGLLEGYPSYLIEPNVTSLSYMRTSCSGQQTFEVGVKNYISFFISMNAGASYNFRGNDETVDGRVNINSITKLLVFNQGTNCTFDDDVYIEISELVAFVSFSLTRTNSSATGESYGIGNRRDGEGSFNVSRFLISYKPDANFVATAGYIVEGRQPTPADVPAGWNHPMHGMKVKEEGVGNFDSIDTITLAVNHGTLDSYDGDATVTYVHPTISATAGYARTLTFSDGTVIPLNDGQKYGNDTTDIHDSNGNVAGELVSDNVPEFHSVTKVPFVIQQMDAVDQVLTDASGNGVERTQAELEAHPSMNTSGKHWFISFRGMILDNLALTGEDFTVREKWMGLI